MIRFLQPNGPAKKIILSGILLVICGAMSSIYSRWPGIGFVGRPGKGVVAKVDGEMLPSNRCVRLPTDVRQQMPQGSSANMSMLLPSSPSGLPTS